MNEKGRFVEVEINKNKVTELGDKVMEVLKEHEQHLSALNITPQNRLKKSLFEMFKK
jgi:adenylate cyclase class IV